LKALQNAPDKYNGLGFAFSPTDPFTGIDLDNCIINGELTDRARKVIKRFKSYTERSQSGTGCHIIVKAKLPGKGKHVKGYEVLTTGGTSL
jgi:putative DNA primase/helicase